MTLAERLHAIESADRTVARITGRGQLRWEQVLALVADQGLPIQSAADAAATP